MYWSDCAFNRRLIQLALAACIAASPAAAQLASGTITDSDGNPVVGATVTFIEEEADGRSHIALADGNGDYRIDFSKTTAIDRSSPRPTTTHLLPNYPNPFNPSTLIPYRLSRGGQVQLTLYNVLGQPIRTLVNETQQAGDHSARWDGRMNSGQGAAAGIYLVQLRTQDVSDVRKMVLLDGARGPDPVASEFIAANKPSSAAQFGNRLFTVEISSADLLLYRQRGLSLAANNILDFQVPRLEAQLILEEDFRIRNVDQLNELLQLTRNQPFRIAGRLSLGRLELVDLSALSNLESVGGDLSLFANQDLMSLTGLENLRSVGGRLRILGNGSLKNLDGLMGLQMLGGNLELNSNQSLTSIEGISHLFPTFTGNLSLSLSGDTGLDPLRRLPEHIVGRLSLYPREAPENLDFLSHVQSIGGSLLLVENFALESFEGLHNLRHIGGSLILAENRRMKNLEGLQALETIGGGLSISRDRSLETLHGLESIREMGGTFSVFAADRLAEFDGLERLARIGGDLILLFNGALKNLDHLDKLRQLEGDVEIISNPSLESIAGIDGMLDTFDGRFEIEFTPALVNFGDLSTRNHLGGGLAIAGAEAPVDLSFLRNLRRVEGDLLINSAQALQGLAGLSNLNSVGGNLKIVNNNQIRDLSGLESLTTVGGGLTILFNRRLTSFEGLNNLTSVLDTLRIDGNPAVENVNALANLTDPPAAVLVWNNNRLLDLSGLGGLTNVAGDLTIGENDDLTSLKGLGNLVRIGGNLAIGVFITDVDRTRGGNRGLVSLQGLNQLDTVDGTLDIRGNPALLDLSALDRLRFLGGRLTVADNGLLTSAVIEALVKRLVAEGFAGEVVVEGNRR